ncbi:MAG: histidine ammonia-lyase [Crocinitomicaceae bacterium]|nr:histidine ammonia-lyase [Crocinitomicaceae bacterium]
MSEHLISTDRLTIDKVAEILSSGARLRLSADAEKRITGCRTYLENKLASGDDVFYGINTGFGSLCNTVISDEDLSTLQSNLVRSHACGIGEEVPQQIVRLMILLKIQGLSYGHSGVRLETVQRLIDFYNNDIFPIVYQQGSLGASGDLAPLAHMSLALIGEGEVHFKGQRMRADDMNNIQGWKPLVMGAKEGIALLNGTQFMSAYGCWSLIQSKQLSIAADKIGAISVDAFDCRISPFSANVNEIRNQKGQIETAKIFRDLLNGSEIITQPKQHVQDPYSFRCIPQVHGASKDAISYCIEIFENEINAVTDNPTIFPETDEIISAGNFHGQPLAISLDLLGIALAELGNISERRTYQMINGKRGLPAFLVANPGINSGFMIPQYAAASVVSQNKQLATPASVDSIESSNGQEDHVSMGANAATKCYRIVENLKKILGIELFNATQALEFRRPLKTSAQLEEIVTAYRKKVPFVEEDKFMQPEIEKSINFIKNL